MGDYECSVLSTPQMGDSIATTPKRKREEEDVVKEKRLVEEEEEKLTSSDEETSDADDDDDDDGCPRWFDPYSISFRPPGVEKADYQIWRKYLNQIEQSEGFDVDIDVFPGCCIQAWLVPIPDISEEREILEELAKLAITKYNDELSEEYEFKDVVKANASPAAGYVYYITFTVKNRKAGDYAPLELFQARVFNGIKKNIVHLCRPKPNPVEN